MDLLSDDETCDAVAVVRGEDVVDFRECALQFPPNETLECLTQEGVAQVPDRFAMAQEPCDPQLDRLRPTEAEVRWWSLPSLHDEAQPSLDTTAA